MAEDQALNDCGCCEGITKLTPQDLANAPGLSALAYRVGTHGSFKTTMLAGLAGPGGIPALTTRADDDPAIALLDATAVLLDVLTFYQERIANEGYLRTATERMSVLELARAIGYELKPGVAAEHLSGLRDGDRADRAHLGDHRGGHEGAEPAGPGREAADLRDGRADRGAADLEQDPAATGRAADPFGGDDHALAQRRGAQPANRRHAPDRRAEIGRRLRGGGPAHRDRDRPTQLRSARN